VRDWELHLGDALGALPGVSDGSADAVVTDPPYNLAQIGRSLQLSQSGPGQDYDRTAQRNGRERGFMGCTWDDTVAFRPDVWAECLRVAKAGAYLLAFGGTRTHHRMMCAVEDAGWELTDTLCWFHGQGFPKGKGCLKPAWEPIVLARKAARRVLPLNIDAARIPIVGPVDPHRQRYNQPGSGDVGGGRVYEDGWSAEPRSAEVPHPDSPRHDARGRWPANVVLQHSPECVCRGTKRVANRATPYARSVPAANAVYGAGFGAKAAGEEPTTYAGPDGTEEVEDWACVEGCPVRLLDEQAGERTSGRLEPHHKRYGPRLGVNTYGDGAGETASAGRSFGGDTGNVSRFFYVSKADRADRGEGNDHPCTKSTTLMQWLCKLVTRPGETVLDPFCGSGSTGVAALRCERRFVGVERDPHYHGIALRRLAAVDGPLFARPAGEAAP
jgi:site-specific DNA-methyltransferase (adenine-specific)